MPVKKIWYPRIDFISISPNSQTTVFQDEIAIVHASGKGTKQIKFATQILE